METGKTSAKAGNEVALRRARPKSVAEWKMAYTTDRKTGKCLESAARADYDAFCKDRGEEPVNGTVFGYEIKRLGVTKTDTDKRFYFGMDLKPSLRLVEAV